MLSLLLFLSGHAVALTEEVSEQDASALISDYLKGEQQIEKATASLRCEGELTRSGRGPTRTETLTISRAPGSYCYIRVGAQNPGAGEKADRSSLVVCQAPDRWFKLSRRGSNTPYVIESLSNGVYRNDYGGWEYTYIGKYIDMFCLDGFKLSTLMKEPSFKVKSIQRSLEGGHSRVDFAFELAGDKVPITSGRAACLPEFDWACIMIEAKGELPNDKVGFRHERKLEYEIREGRALPKRLVDQYKFVAEPDSKAKSSDLDMTEVFTHRSVSFETVPQSSFTLSAFGLPEIPTAPRPTSSFFSFRNPLLWVSLLASLAFFVGLRELRRRAISAA